jgi:hypothetical protein
MRRYIAIALLLAACHKSNPTPPPAFTVSANINGTPTTFNAIISVDTFSTPGTVYIVAHSDSANLTPLLEITLSNTPLKPGTYPYVTTGPDSTGSSATPASPVGLLGYTLWTDSVGTFVQYSAFSDTVTLTTVTQTWLSGTFQGTCEYTPDSVVSITNGQFAVGYPQR